MGEREDRRDGVCGGEEERGTWGAWSEGGGDGEDFRSEQVTWGWCVGLCSGEVDGSNIVGTDCNDKATRQ
jgi:hypothetical protein